MSEESPVERTERLAHELEKSAGYRYICARDLHKTSTYVFMENGRVLLAALKAFKGYLAFPGMDERTETDRQHREIMRHFQNFATSALALVHASRNWVKDIRRRFPAFCEEYDARVATDFADSLNHQFIQDLRNYMSHSRLPMSASRGTFTLQFAIKGGPEQRQIDWAIVLDLEELRKKGKWSTKTKAYLAACGEDIDLLTIVEPYLVRSAAFYDWFYPRLEELHADDVAESVKEQKVRNSTTSIRPARKNPPFDASA